MFDTRRILYGINEKEYINSFGYEMMIRKALKEGKLKHCITRYGEYYIEAREQRFQNFSNYAILLLNFDLYHKNYPNSKLQEIYEHTLEGMLCTAIPSYIYCAALCELTHIEKLDRNSNFHFKLSHKDEYLQLVISSMELYHQSIKEFIEALFLSSGKCGLLLCYLRKS